MASRSCRGVRAAGRASCGRPKGLPPVDPSTDLLSFLKPHRHAQGAGGRRDGTCGASPDAADGDAGSAEPALRWDEDIQRAEPALRAAWRVNLVSLDFRTVTLVTLAAMLALCLFVAAVMPPRAHRTRETDALEFALVTLLTVIFSPLSFNYAYVWLMYPTTLALHRVLGDPLDLPARPRRLALAWLAAVLFIPASAIAMPQAAQAVGNLFIPALLLVFGLGWMLRAEGRRLGAAEDSPAHVPHRGIANHRPFRDSATPRELG